MKNKEPLTQKTISLITAISGSVIVVLGLSTFFIIKATTPNYAMIKDNKVVNELEDILEYPSGEKKINMNKYYTFSSYTSEQVVLKINKEENGLTISLDNLFNLNSTIIEESKDDFMFNLYLSIIDANGEKIDFSKRYYAYHIEDGSEKPKQQLLTSNAIKLEKFQFNKEYKEKHSELKIVFDYKENVDKDKLKTLSVDKDRTYLSFFVNLG